MNSERILRSFRLIGRCLLVLGIIAFALAAVSAPLIPDLSFISANFQDDISFLAGAWGGCVTQGEQTTCPQAQFGYFLSLANFPGRIADGDPPVEARLTYAFILLPLTGALALAGLMVSIISQRQFFHKVATGLLSLALLSGTAVTALLLYVFINAKSSINAQFEDNPAVLGPALWVAVGGLAALLLGTLILVGARPARTNKRKEVEMAQHRPEISNPVPIIIDDRSSEYYQASMTDRPLVGNDRSSLHRHSSRGRFTFPAEPKAPVEQHAYSHSHSGSGFYQNEQQPWSSDAQNFMYLSNDPYVHQQDGAEMQKVPSRSPSASGSRSRRHHK